ncbi:MAG: class I SAM-dependent methyltransferase [Xanthobacteraceae bacterium]
MLSDGRIVDEPLDRLSCLACGATSHAVPMDPRRFYTPDYRLPRMAVASDAARAKAYAAWIVSLTPRPRRLLEVGCGSGALIRELAERWPDVACVGVDPALPVEFTSERVTLRRGTIADLPDARFDLVIAINVIEHAFSPHDFLSSLGARLVPDGRIVVVCPDAAIPNVELLFLDHVHSLMPRAIATAAEPLSLAGHHPAPPAIGDFQAFVFGLGDDATQGTFLDFRALAEGRHRYLASWQELDERLLSRLSNRRHVAFGAGQMAALIRAYAPGAWARLERLIVDDPSDAWDLGKPVTSPRSLDDATVLIATASRSQARVARRLAQDGVCSIRFDDIVPR